MARPSSAEIDEVQNQDLNLRRQLAARHYYFEAKLIQRVGGSVATLLALTSPLVLFCWADAGPWLAATAGLWIFVSRFLLERFRTELIEKGALAQELFDCEVLGLEWNPDLGARPATEDIWRASQRALKKIDKIRNWYEPSAGASWPISVLSCQRANAVWSRRQHFNYGRGLLGAVIVWFVVGIVFAAIDSASLVQYLTIIALPSLPALLETAERGEQHLEFAASRQAHEAQAESLRDSGNASPLQLREFQDSIFDLRRNGPLIPEWFYNRFRDRNEEDMKVGSDDFPNGAPS